MLSTGVARADPGFLEKAFVCIKVRVCGLILFFIGYSKRGRAEGGGGSSEPP